MTVSYTHLDVYKRQVQGDEVSKVFISDDLAQSNAWSPAVGKLVNVEFTPKGKISIIKTVQEK